MTILIVISPPSSTDESMIAAMISALARNSAVRDYRLVVSN